MAYINQDTKKKIAAALKLALKDVNIKYSLSINNSSTIKCTISKSDIDFIGDYNATAIKNNRTDYRGDAVYNAPDRELNVNHHHIDKAYSAGVAKVLNAIKECLLTPDYFDESDPYSDYFNVSHYIDIRIGAWNKPFVLITE